MSVNASGENVLMKGWMNVSVNACMLERMYQQVSVSVPNCERVSVSCINTVINV